MAVTITQQPQKYMPAFSPQYFSATSTQTAQPNFTYTVIVTDVISSVSQTYQIPARPGGAMVWNAQVFAQVQMTTDFIFYTFGWLKYGSIRKLTVNVGETYGTVPAYHAGSNINYYIWNGVLDVLQQPFYNFQDYAYDSAGMFNYLKGPSIDTTYENRSSYIYLLIDEAGGNMNAIQILTYDINGVNLKNSIIANPFFASSNYRDRFISIDVGHKGLSAISASGVTGDYPIVTPDMEYYDVIDVTAAITTIKRFYVKCDPKFQTQTVHYLAKDGHFGTINFSKSWEPITSKTETLYKRNPNKLTAGVYGYDYEAAVDRVLSSQSQSSITMRTDWLTYEQVALFKECFDSPICYLDRGNLYASIRPVTDSYRDVPHYSEPLIQITMEFLFTHQNHRQLV